MLEAVLRKLSRPINECERRMTRRCTSRAATLASLDFCENGGRVAVGSAEQGLALIVAVGAHACAIPVDHVAETMRPLPIEPIAGTPQFILGLSVIRGAPTPIVDLAMLVEGRARAASYARLVLLKVGAQRIAIAVDVVVGLRRLDGAPLDSQPPILRAVHTDYIAAIGSLDAQLLMVLHASRIIPDQAWADIRAGAAAMQ
jgi:purine-binding chemotaxis protein CheW